MKSNREPLARIGGRLLRDKFAILRNLHCFEFSVHKRMDDIVANIGPTAEIIERIRPVYNFKASE